MSLPARITEPAIVLSPNAVERVRGSIAMVGLAATARLLGVGKIAVANTLAGASRPATTFLIEARSQRLPIPMLMLL